MVDCLGFVKGALLAAAGVCRYQYVLRGNPSTFIVVLSMVIFLFIFDLLLFDSAVICMLHQSTVDFDRGLASL